MLDKLGASQDKSEDENRKERAEEYLSREKEIRNWELSTTTSMLVGLMSE